MPGWVLDEKRFREEVLRALDNRWEPKRDMFRCAQLPLDVEDPAVVAAALKGVKEFLMRAAATSSGPVKVLQKVLPDVERTLTDPAARAAHRRQVLAERSELERALRAELGGMTAVPPAAVAALATARQKFVTREDVQAALGAIGCAVREPVALPGYGRAPSNWRSVAHDVTFLGHATLRAYLEKYFGTAGGVTGQQVDDRKKKLRSTARGDELTAEMSTLTNVRKWLDEGRLTELLRADLLRELAAEASMGGDRLTAALTAPGTDRYLADLGLPKAADLGYALLCAQRYPAEDTSSWQVTYRDARSNRDLRTAHDVLVANRSSLDKQFTAELDALTAELAEIAGLAERARALERTDVEQAADLYVRIGQRCRDPEAESALRRCRPAEPPSATATVGGDDVTVAWAPSTAWAGEIAYRVVRHVTGRADVPVEERLTGLTVVDTGAPAGVEVTYSVWTLRDGEPSREGRRTAPVAVLRGVRRLELMPSADLVELRWELPDGASGARVRRDGGPARRVEGTGLRDGDVRNGVEYTYLVESEYRLAGGFTGYGPAVTGRARPQEPPPQVRDLACVPEEDAIVLTWTPPSRGEVEVRLLDEAPSVRPGQTLTATALGRLGARLRSAGPATGGELRAAPPGDGRRHWLLPVTVADGVAVAGVAVEYDSRLPAVTGLRAERLGNRLQLRWTWPARVSEVLVVCRDGAPPTGPDDPRAERRRLTHARYQMTGASVAAAAGEQWIGVCVSAYTDGEPVYGPMVTVSATAPRELTYEVQKVSGFRNRHKRRLVVTAGDGRPVGAVRVVARDRIPPLTPDDGQELRLVPAGDSGGPTLTGEFDLTVRARPLFLRAFPADGGDVLVPTHPMQLRID